VPPLYDAETIRTFGSPATFPKYVSFDSGSGVGVEVVTVEDSTGVAVEVVAAVVAVPLGVTVSAVVFAAATVPVARTSSEAIPISTMYRF
jgi:hypothetical protein